MTIYSSFSNGDNADFDLSTLCNVNLRNSTFDEINPDISGNYVSWQAWDGNDWEVYSAEITEVV